MCSVTVHRVSIMVYSFVFTSDVPDGSGFGGLGVVCWPLVPKFTGSNPAEAVRFLRAK